MVPFALMAVITLTYRLETYEDIDDGGMHLSVTETHWEWRLYRTEAEVNILTNYYLDITMFFIQWGVANFHKKESSWKPGALEKYKKLDKSYPTS